MGDNEQQAIKDLEIALNGQYPIVIVEGSPFCNNIIAKLQEIEPDPNWDKKAKELKEPPKVETVKDASPKHAGKGKDKDKTQENKDAGKTSPTPNDATMKDATGKTSPQPQK